MQISVAHTLTPLWTGKQTPELGPCIPPRSPTAVTSVVLLVPLSGSLASASQSVSLAPSDHQTRLCDSVRPASSQFQGRPLQLSEGSRCSCLACRNHSPTGEGCDRAGPPAVLRTRFFRPYFIAPKKSGGLRPILDLHVLNRALHKLPFRMLTQQHIFGCVRPRDWFAAIDLIDAYFHVSILLRHRPFLWFAFEGRAYLSPSVFTKVAEAALVPLREQGVHILNYLNNWLILAQSQDQLCEHRDLVLCTLGSWAFGLTGKRTNSPPCRGSLFSVMELDLVNQRVCLTQECAKSVLNCLNTIKSQVTFIYITLLTIEIVTK